VIVECRLLFHNTFQAWSVRLLLLLDHLLFSVVDISAINYMSELSRFVLSTIPSGVVDLVSHTGGLRKNKSYILAEM
jgi:hypothetical protein